MVKQQAVESVMPPLYNEIVKYLKSLCYWHADFSIYVMGDDESFGIQLGTWKHNDKVSMRFTDKVCANFGPYINVSTFEEAKAVIDNFHLLNEEYLELAADLLQDEQDGLSAKSIQ